MKNQYPTFSMDAVRSADFIQRHKAGLVAVRLIYRRKPSQKVAMPASSITSQGAKQFVNIVMMVLDPVYTIRTFVGLGNHKTLSATERKYCIYIKSYVSMETVLD